MSIKKKINILLCTILLTSRLFFQKIGNSNTFTMLESGGSGVVQVTNVSPGASSEQIKTLFTFLGNIEEIELYPKSP